ncbi:MAG: GNAT family N-acetyltransferase [Actinomycetota bacterium]
MRIQQLTADDWVRYRDIRLTALTIDAPAFASTHEREAKFDEDTWRRRITVGPDGRAMATFVEIDDGNDRCGDGGNDQPIGTAQVVFTEHHRAPMLVAMWVHPDVRRRGVARRLVQACADWARAKGEREMLLWVVRNNEPAIRLYESFGFRATGHTDTLPSDASVDEIEMLMALG